MRLAAAGFEDPRCWGALLDYCPRERIAGADGPGHARKISPEKLVSPPRFPGLWPAASVWTFNCYMITAMHVPDANSRYLISGLI